MFLSNPVQGRLSHYPDLPAQARKQRIKIMLNLKRSSSQLIERKSDTFSDAHPEYKAYATASNHLFHQIEEYGKFKQRQHQCQKGHAKAKHGKNIRRLFFTRVQNKMLLHIPKNIII